MSVATYLLINLNKNVETIFFGVSNLVSTISLLMFIFYSSRQIEEEQRNRMLEHQPLPIITNYESYIETPSVYINIDRMVGEDLYLPQFIYRLCFFHKLYNIGNSSAISIDVCTDVTIIMDETKTFFKPIAKRIPFMKIDDTSGVIRHTFLKLSTSVLDTFIKGDITQFPIISVCVLYKNTLGSYFKTNQKYRLWLVEEDYGVIKEWLKIIKTAEVNYNDEIKLIKRLENTEEKRRIHDQILKDFDSKFNIKNINLWVKEIPGTFSVSILSESEYEKETSDLAYPRTIRGPLTHEELEKSKAKNS